MIKPLLTLLALLIAHPCLAETAKPPLPEDFAYGWNLSVEPGAALYEFSLPDEVYRYSTRADYGDLRIFNNKHETLPHSLRRPGITLEAPPPAITLAVFPLYANQEAKPETLSLKIQTDKHGAVIGVRNAGAAEAGKFIQAYLLDTSQIQQPLSRLQLVWRGTTEGFVTQVSVEASDDLNQWSSVTRNATLAELRQGENLLTRNSIELPNTKAKYLRLSWPLGEKGLHLESITGLAARSEREPERHWLELSGEASTDESHVYLFDTQGRYPVDRVNLTLPQGNRLINASLQSRATPEATWRMHAQTVFYSLNSDGNTVTNEPLKLAANPDRYWRLQIFTNDAAPPASLLRIGWVPDTLSFIGSNDNDYLLAYGSATVGPAAQPIESLLNSLSKQNIKVIPAAASLGAATTLGGEARLTPGPAPLPWRAMIFWAVLVMGVLLLAWMAMGLYRQMNTPSSEG